MLAASNDVSSIVASSDDDFIRMDFRLGEVNVSADWVAAGKRQASANGGAAPQSSAVRLSLPNAAQNICGAAMCSANGTLRCSRCKTQYYCSAKCQKSDWKTHKQTCTPAA